MSGANLMNPFRFAAPPPSNVPIAQIQKALSARSSATSVSATFTGTPARYNLIVACLVTDSGTFNTPAGFTLAVSVTTAKANTAIFYKVAGAGESKTVTVDGLDNTGPVHVLSILEYEGLLSTSPLDKTASNTATTNVTAISTGTTAATAQAKELAIAVVGFEKNAATSTSWSNAFAEQHASMDPVGIPSEVSLGVAHKILSATGAQETTWTVANASKGSGCVATFKGN